MRTCYLHLGMPKTGSSSIQGAFHGFETNQVAYAKLRGSNHGPLMCMAFARNPEALPEARWQKAKPMRERLTLSDAKTTFMKAIATKKSLILSGEIMIDRLDDDEFSDMISTLRSRFDRVVAIAYIRPLASLAASQFQQRVKTGQRRFVIPSPDYRKRFEKVVSEFDPADIVWRRFDRADLMRGDIVDDFSHILGVGTPPKNGILKNESLTTEALAALYAFNRHTAPWLKLPVRNKLRARILEQLRVVGNTKFCLAPEIVARHIAEYRDDIAWMEAVCNFDVTGQITVTENSIGSEQQLFDIAARASETDPKAGLTTT
jgi:hypothetical protein